MGERQYGLIGAHCFLGGCRSAAEVPRVIFQKLLQAMPEQGLFEKARQLFVDHIKGGQIFGFAIEFRRDEQTEKDLLANFASKLRQLFDVVVEAGRKGIFVVLDDLNGVAGDPTLATFLKSLVDEMATSPPVAIPLLLLLVGLEERLTELRAGQPSVERIFDVVSLDLMSEREVEEFFLRAFDSVGTTVRDEAMTKLLHYSGGHPALMHEIGDAVFWIDSNRDIDTDDANAGVIEAAENVGRKYLDRQVYDAVRSRTYVSILRKLARTPLGSVIRRAEALASMSDTEKRNFDNFVTRMRSLGVLGPGEERGTYTFASELYRLYFFLEALRASRA